MFEKGKIVPGGKQASTRSAKKRIAMKLKRA